MSCDDVRRALIEGPSGVRADLREHLAGCASCRALAEEVRLGDEAVDEWVDEFARGGSFDAAWKRAVASVEKPAPAWHPGRWALAAAALLAVASFAAWRVVRVDTTEAIVAPEPVAEMAVHEAKPGQVRLAAPVYTSAQPVRHAMHVRPSRPVDCDNLVRMEPSAMMGKLSPDEVDCLESRFAEEPRERDKISRILMANAYSMGAMTEWAWLVERHMTEISQSDPDLAYKYALYLSKRRVSRSEDVIRWADVALRHSGVWTGETYASRVYALHKLRTEAAQMLWDGAEESYAANPTPENDALVLAARARTRTFAEEWHTVALRGSKDAAPAASLCELAGDPCD